MGDRADVWLDGVQVFEQEFELYQVRFIVRRDDAVDAEFVANKMCNLLHLVVREFAMQLEL